MLLHTTANGRHTSASRRSGFVIIAVLMVVTVLSLAAYQYSALMDAEVMAAERIRKTTESKAAADSGVIFVMAHVADPTAFEGVLNSNPINNSGSFQSVVVNDGLGPKSQVRFSLVTLDYGQASTGNSVPLKFGLIDEAGKLNVNALFALDATGKVLHDALMKLPNMTDEIAWSIVDWIDPDDTENSGGAEEEYYIQSRGYHCKNAPLDSIEELLLVKGVTPTLLFGTDRNGNGKLDPGEDDGTGFSLGWAAYLTVYSREPNVDSTGKPRINLNGNDMQQLLTDLTNAVGSDLATFIVGYRLFGGSSSSGSGSSTVVGTANGGGIVLAITTKAAGTIGQLQQKIQEALAASSPPQPKQRISSLFSLVNATASIQIETPGPNGKSQQTTVSVASPLADKGQQVDLMSKLLDLTTTQQGTELPAHVNVNTAPREVLMALPGITDSMADQIIAKRPSYSDGEAPDANFKTVAWLMQEGMVPINTLQSLERYITARTQVYRVQSIGYFTDGGPMSRVEAVIDANQGKPRIVYYRDLTELGRSIDPRNLNR